MSIVHLKILIFSMRYQTFELQKCKTTCVVPHVRMDIKGFFRFFGGVWNLFSKRSRFDLRTILGHPNCQITAKLVDGVNSPCFSLSFFCSANCFGNSFIITGNRFDIVVP